MKMHQMEMERAKNQWLQQQQQQMQQWQQGMQQGMQGMQIPFMGGFNMGMNNMGFNMNYFMPQDNQRKKMME